MKIQTLAMVISLLLAISIFGKANEKDHKHEASESHNESEHEDHGHGEKEGDEHDHGNEHGNEAESDGHGHEENEQVGPGKGIVSASEEEGIEISPQAEKNFEIQRIKISSNTQIELPKSAVVTAGTEVNLYRYRKGHYKRVDFEFISKSEKTVVVKSKDLKASDEIVVKGMGLLRIAEIAAFGGAPEGHSH